MGDRADIFRRKPLPKSRSTSNLRSRPRGVLDSPEPSLPPPKINAKLSSTYLEEHAETEAPPPLPPRRGSFNSAGTNSTRLEEFRSSDFSLSADTLPPSTKEAPFWKTALDETRYFASGLLSRPTESTRHYTILRHSPGLILYRGPSTSVAITIFSSPSHPLPPDRTLHLQRRGLSGTPGLALGALLGTPAHWTDVTPAAQTTPAALDAPSERAWQRDLARAANKATAHRHRPRETHVVRIPAAAADGYFRLLLCTGARGRGLTVLCPSPVFRVASVAADASVLRGASLRTAPLEVGLKVAGAVGRRAAAVAAGPVAGAARVGVGRVVGRAERVFVGRAKTLGVPGELVGRGVRAARSVEGLGPGLGRETEYMPFEGSESVLDEGLVVIGSEEGPQRPFPVKFQGEVVKGSGRSMLEMGLPTANLGDVSEDITLRFKGVYFGWTCILPQKGLGDISHDWHEALVTIGPPSLAAAKVVAKNVITIHILHDFDGAVFFKARIKVILMGHLHTLPPAVTPIEDSLVAMERDALITTASLSRENWGPEMTLDRLKTAKSSRSLAEKYASAQDRVQKQADRVPFHLAGVRTMGAERRDQMFGNGGYWVAR